MHAVVYMHSLLCIFISQYSNMVHFMSMCEAQMGGGSPILEAFASSWSCQCLEFVGIVSDFCRLDSETLTWPVVRYKLRYSQPLTVCFLSFTDTSNWYKRVENNGWRIVSDQLISKITKSGDPLTLESSSKKFDFHPCKVWFWGSTLIAVIVIFWSCSILCHCSEMIWSCYIDAVQHTWIKK